VEEQVPVTIGTRVRTEAFGRLKELLETIGRDPAGNAVLPFGRFAGVHFARFVALEPTTDLDGRPIPPSLLFFTDVDGSAEAYLQALVDTAGEGIDRLYAHCEGYPQEARLRDAIEEFLDRPGRDWSGMPATAARAAIQEFVASQESLRWAREPLPGPGREWWLGEARTLLAGAVRIALLGPVALVALPAGLILLRLHELTDQARRERPSERRIQELAELEDRVAHNQFSAVGFVKPSPFRRLVALTVLWLVNLGAPRLFPRADLAGVKTIHTARWVFIDEGRRLLFGSNYDGNLESYMDDFIDKTAWGLNAVFSNGVDYPPTDWLVLNGASDEEAFKSFIRTHQVPTQVWYAAYDHLTAVNIENNARIREGLSGSLSQSEVEAWLRRF
jgi:hypothetical protein